MTTIHTLKAFILDGSFADFLLQFSIMSIFITVRLSIGLSISETS